MKKVFVLFCSLLLQFAIQAQTVVDYDGNVYDTVMIGEQIWLGENLKVTHYNNGVPIPNVTDFTSWGTLATGARCYYNNDSVTYDSVYGALYNFYTITDPNGICPAGWHVPSNADWEATEIYLGGQEIAGGKMKEAGTLHWKSPNTGATNSTGFTGLPGGARDPVNDFRFLTENGVWWTASATGPTNAWSTYFWYLNTGVDHNPTPKKYGFSIRCLKDIETGTGEVNGKENRLSFILTSNTLTIVTEDLPFQSGRVIIYNLFGQQIITGQVTASDNTIDIGTLPPGIYIVKLAGTNLVIVGKFMKD